MKIPPPNRYRLEQGSNLQLPSFDRRVYRSNRTLTASEIVFWEKNRRSSLEPFPLIAFTNGGRSYLQPMVSATARDLMVTK
jgi:hypothetical protein